MGGRGKEEGRNCVVYTVRKKGQNGNMKKSADILIPNSEPKKSKKFNPRVKPSYCIEGAAVN